jgi:hypothetical protein
MDNTTLSDAATGIFRLRSDDPHMTNSTIVDLNDDAYTTLTTVEVRSGAVVLHCFTSLEAAELADEEEEEEETEEESEEKEDSDDEAEDEDDDEEEDDDKQAKTYTIASGNSVTVRATVVRLKPVGMETAEGVYRVQMMKSAD